MAPRWADAYVNFKLREHCVANSSVSGRKDYFRLPLALRGNRASLDHIYVLILQAEPFGNL